MNLQSLIALLLKSQKVPIWIWITVGIFGIVVPPVYDFLTSNGIILPNWTTILKEAALWLVGINPLLLNSNNNNSGKTFAWLFLLLFTIFGCTIFKSYFSQNIIATLDNKTGTTIIYEAPFTETETLIYDDYIEVESS